MTSSSRLESVIRARLEKARKREIKFGKLFQNAKLEREYLEGLLASCDDGVEPKPAADVTDVATSSTARVEADESDEVDEDESHQPEVIDAPETSWRRVAAIETVIRESGGRIRTSTLRARVSARLPEMTKSVLFRTLRENPDRFLAIRRGHWAMRRTS